MANTYTWSIPKNGLITMPSLNGQSDVVVNIQYTVTGTDGTHTASFDNMVQVTYEAGAPFTPFEQLTKADVIGWVQASHPNLVAQVEAALDNMIDRIINPPVRPVQKNVPWNSAA
jgi:hypothetical protein